jgi:hypothetical protein
MVRPILLTTATRSVTTDSHTGRYRLQNNRGTQQLDMVGSYSRRRRELWLIACSYVCLLLLAAPLYTIVIIIIITMPSNRTKNSRPHNYASYYVIIIMKSGWLNAVRSSISYNITTSKQ